MIHKYCHYVKILFKKYYGYLLVILSLIVVFYWSTPPEFDLKWIEPYRIFPENPLNNNTIYVNRAYVICRKRKNGESWSIRMTAFARCRFKKDSPYGPIIIQTKSNYRYNATLRPIHGNCYDGGWSPHCFWGVWFIEVQIPKEAIHGIGNMVCRQTG